MKKLLALTMFFSPVLAFSPPERVADLSVEHDTYVLAQDYDCDLITKCNLKLLNEAEVEILPGVDQEPYETTYTVANNSFSYELQNERVKTLEQDFINSKAKKQLNNKFTLNHKLYEISFGDKSLRLQC